MQRKSEPNWEALGIERKEPEDATASE